MLRVKATDDETINLVHGATSGMLATIDMDGEGAVAEWEVSELLCLLAAHYQ